jgi:hypothetical protein
VCVFINGSAIQFWGVMATISMNWLDKEN